MILVLAITLTSSAPNHPRNEWRGVVKAAAQHYDLDWRLLDTVIQVESNWDPNAVSHKGAMGLGQLMPRTAEYLKVENPFDPGQNIWGSAWYIRQLHNKFKDWRLTLAAYNAGPGRVSKCGCIPAIQETIEYVDKIVSRWEKRITHNTISIFLVEE